MRVYLELSVPHIFDLPSKPYTSTASTMQWQQCFSLIALATNFAQHVYGQTGSGTSTGTAAMPAVATQSFDSSQVSSAAKCKCATLWILSSISTTDHLLAQWCLSQTNTCPQICYGEAPTNTCNSVSHFEILEMLILMLALAEYVDVFMLVCEWNNA